MTTRWTLTVSVLAALGAGCGGPRHPDGHVRGVRVTTNDTKVIEQLRLIAQGQAQFKRAAHVDLDGDGVGEYGWFREIAGSQPLRGGGQPLFTDAPVAVLLGLVNPHGSTKKQGHYFRMYLPRDSGAAEPEPASGGDPAPHADAREKRWAVYAWPEEFGAAGDRCYFVNQDGKVYATWCKARRYSGVAESPAAGAALDTKGTAPANLDAPVAQGNRAAQSGDGNVWELVKG